MGGRVILCPCTLLYPTVLGGRYRNSSLGGMEVMARDKYLHPYLPTDQVAS